MAISTYLDFEKPVADLEKKIAEARTQGIPAVIVIDTEPYPGTGVGGFWWGVAIPEVSARDDVRKARAN